MLDLQRLRMLRELEARGTLGAVAHALDYTPSAVSQGLATLEREAGTKLLEPAGRGVRLTDAAHVLVRHADALLAQVEAAEAELAAASGTVAGTVRVAGFQSAVLRLALPALARLATQAPGVRVEVAEVEVETALPALRLGAVDVALADEYDGMPRPRLAGLHRERLLREELLLVLRADHPLATRRTVPLERLRDAAWAISDAGTGHHAMLLRTCRERGGFEPDLRHRSTDVVVLLEMVRQAGAVTLLPELALRRGDPTIAVRSLAGSGTHREVHAITREGAAARPAVAAVLAALRAVSP
ncbi:MAG: putative RuBisCO transcriptional regulator [Solirubrobacterales bacterium]|jgi:DNA-binding transcriptional LysR family regulator|nr:putative RuBisCO transcriptional regulator [Solirubrobacterales bacterium]